MLLVSIRAFTAAGSPPTEYNLSGITAYEGNPGLKYNSLFYAGSQDVVNLMLTQIAELMNFASLSYFSRYCTKHLGQSPSEYRQSLQPK